MAVNRRPSMTAETGPRMARRLGPGLPDPEPADRDAVIPGGTARGPAQLVAALDSEVATLDRGQGEDFLTAVVAQIDRAGRMLLLGAGHPDPLRIHGGHVTALAVPDRQPPLGLGGIPQPTRVPLAPGEKVLFYTHGLLEARHHRTREFFPVLSAAQNAFTHAPLPEGTHNLVRALLEWTHGSLSDDIALVAMQRLDRPHRRRPAGNERQEPARRPVRGRGGPRPLPVEGPWAHGQVCGVGWETGRVSPAASASW
jgi:hypothetical protein